MSATTLVEAVPSLAALELLYERPGLPALALPEALAPSFGDSLGFSEPWLYADFVSTPDDVVALPDAVQPNQTISAGSESDRLVRGFRACADAVLVGAEQTELLPARAP